MNKTKMFAGRAVFASKKARIYIALSSKSWYNNGKESENLTGN
jgi:hypothetical protein